MNSVKLQDLQN